MESLRLVRGALARFIPPEHAAGALAVTDLFSRELGDYAEIIAGPGMIPIGFMTRGESSSTTERCRAALAMAGMPADAIEHHRALSSWFEHRRAFFKIEWHAREGGVEPLAACYFRRRPAVEDALARLGGLGVRPEVLAHAREVAALLGKATIHFVAAAFRPGLAVHHKLYFSQFVPADQRAEVRSRLEGVFEQCGVTGAARDRWRALHDRCVPDGEPTLFVSIQASSDRVAPGFKIDYPEVAPADAAAWLEADGRAEACEAVERDAARTVEVAGGAQALSFLGVRFAPGAPAAQLKYYADLPGAPR